MDIDSTVSTVAATLGGFILLYGVCSLVIKEKLFISEACNYNFFFVAVVILLAHLFSYESCRNLMRHFIGTDWVQPY